MKARLQLMFPYVCALIVVGLIVWRNGASTVSSSQVDPVCGMEVGGGIALEWGEDDYYFCTEHCRTLFRANPEDYAGEQCMVCRSEKGAGAENHPHRSMAAVEAAAVAEVGEVPPMCGGPAGGNGRAQIAPEAAVFEATWQGKVYRFCSGAHRDRFREDPAGYFMHTMWGIPNWLYYASIGLVLVFSFGVFEGWGAPGGAGRSGRARFDLLGIAGLNRLLAHPLTRFGARALMVGFFVLILAAGLFGNQIPSKNIAPLLTWTVWWGGLVVLILYAGKAWCYVCPWDALADWAEGFRFWGRKREGLGLGLGWPKLLRNIWPATVLFVGLTWVEIGFGVTMKPRATAWLGLGMLGLAFVCAFVFDRRSFCRYGCLVGRVSGLYALFSPVEVRAKDREVCRACRTHSCYRGNEVGEPCPTFQYLGAMDQNTYCISCMECLKSCEQGNVSLRLRPWGEDLASAHRPRSDEAYLALLMLSLTGFHGLTMTGVWRQALSWMEAGLGLGEAAAFSLGMALLMVAPAAVYGGLVALSRWSAGRASLGYREYFIRYAYALLPIALFYHLAHNSEHLLMEGQKVLALLSDPFGWAWDLFGTAGRTFAPLVGLPTLWLVQVFLVVVGHVYSLWVARNTARALFSDSGAALRSQIPMLLAMILFSTMSLWLLKQPMEMRTSAM